MINVSSLIGQALGKTSALANLLGGGTPDNPASLFPATGSAADPSGQSPFARLLSGLAAGSGGLETVQKQPQQVADGAGVSVAPEQSIIADILRAVARGDVDGKAFAAKATTSNAQTPSADAAGMKVQTRATAGTPDDASLHLLPGAFNASIAGAPTTSAQAQQTSLGEDGLPQPALSRQSRSVRPYSAELNNPRFGADASLQDQTPDLTDADMLGDSEDIHALAFAPQMSSWLRAIPHRGADPEPAEVAAGDRLQIQPDAGRNAPPANPVRSTPLQVSGTAHDQSETAGSQDKAATGTLAKTAATGPDDTARPEPNRPVSAAAAPPTGLMERMVQQASSSGQTESAMPRSEPAPTGQRSRRAPEEPAANARNADSTPVNDRTAALRQQMAAVQPAPVATVPETRLDASYGQPFQWWTGAAMSPDSTGAMAPLSGAASAGQSFSATAQAAQVQQNAAQHAGQHDPGSQVAIAVRRAVQANATEFSIRLEPADLGRVDVKLDIGGDGRVTATVMADNSQTVDLLRRDAHLLERALADAGLKTDSGGLNFSLRQQQAQTGQSFGDQDQFGSRDGASSEVAGPDTISTSDSNEIITTKSNRLLDLKA